LVLLPDFPAIDPMIANYAGGALPDVLVIT
jgi:hypothetical protein